MNFDVKSVRRSKAIYRSHMVAYLCSILFFIMSIFANGGITMVKDIMSVCFFVCAIVVETIFKRREETPRSIFLETGYFGIRTLAVIIFYISESSKNQGYVYLGFLIVFAVEHIFFLAYDDKDKRLQYYILIGAMFLLPSFVLLWYLQRNGQISLDYMIRESAGGLAVYSFIVMTGEILAAIWDYFVNEILSQNRALEDLQEANEELKVQQEKINKVNELLGIQKIELQYANKRIKRAHDEMSVQNEIASSITSVLDKEELMNKVTRIMQLRLDLDLVTVILEKDDMLDDIPGEQKQKRYFAIASSMGDSFDRNIKKSIEQTDLSELLMLNKTYIQNNATDTAKFFEYLTTSQELPSVIYIPIFKQEQRLGTLVVGKNKENAFNEGRAFYENIASQLSIGISNVHLYEKMKDMAIRDGLTRIYNRTHFSEVVHDYLNEAMVKKTKVSLALFDIDKFKMVNDTYGHRCGDQVICYVASLLNQRAIQHGGIAGRYGGEEFVIAFYDKTVEEAYEIVKKIHQQIKEKSVIYEDYQVEVRASVGVAGYPETCSNPGDLLTRADWAMYHSKRNGRDQITIDSDQVTDKM